MANLLTLYGLNTANFLSVADSGLESGVGDWTVQSNCTISSDATWAHSGTKSLMLTPTGLGPTATILNTTLALPVVPAAQYKVSAWGTAAGGFARTVAVNRSTFTAAQGFLGFSSGAGTMSVTAGTWTFFQFTFTAEGTARWMQLQVGCSNMTNGGTEFAWFDDIQVQRIG